MIPSLVAPEGVECMGTGLLFFSLPLVAKGIQFARPVYIESTLLFGREVVDSLGVPEDEVNDVIESFRRDNYALVRASATSTPDAGA